MWEFQSPISVKLLPDKNYIIGSLKLQNKNASVEAEFYLGINMWGEPKHITFSIYLMIFRSNESSVKDKFYLPIRFQRLNSPF